MKVFFLLVLVFRVSVVFNGLILLGWKLIRKVFCVLVGMFFCMLVMKKLILLLSVMFVISNGMLFRLEIVNCFMVFMLIFMLLKLIV